MKVGQYDTTKLTQEVLYHANFLYYRPMAYSHDFDKVAYDSEDADWVMTHKKSYKYLSLKWNVIGTGVELWHVETGSVCTMLCCTVL